MKFTLKNVRENLQELGDQPPPSEVVLDRYCRDGDREMDAFLECLKQCKTVQKIFFSTDFLMRMEDTTVLKFFEAIGHLSTLQQLSIQSSSRFHLESIPVEGLLQLRHSTSIHTMEFHDMQVTAEQKPFLYALAKTLHGHSTIRTIRAQNFFANDYTNTTDNILDPLLDSLATIPNIQQLELTGCGSHTMNGRNVVLLSHRALQNLITQTSSTLQTLEFSFLEFNDEYFATIVTALQKSSSSSSSSTTAITDSPSSLSTTSSSQSTLHTLILDYHDLCSDGFSRMMKAMELNETIKHLSLRSLHDIGCDGFAQAMRMLQVNYTIETLSVTTTPSEQAEIDLYLRMNSAGRRLLRNHKVSLHEWVDILARHSDDIDVTRHLIVQVPGLCNATGPGHNSISHYDYNDQKADGNGKNKEIRGASSPISTIAGI